MSFGDQDPMIGESNPYSPPLTTSTTSPLPPPQNAPLAGRLNRFGARMIDGFIGLIITGPVMYATGYIQRLPAQQISFLEIVGWAVFGIVVYTLIHGYLLATRGQTVGKLLAKIRIVDYHTDQLLSLPKLIGIREFIVVLVVCIPFAGPFLNLVSLLLIFGSEKRCGHDLIAGTKVVDVQ